MELFMLIGPTAEIFFLRCASKCSRVFPSFHCCHFRRTNEIQSMAIGPWLVPRSPAYRPVLCVMTVRIYRPCLRRLHLPIILHTYMRTILNPFFMGHSLFFFHNFIPTLMRERNARSTPNRTGIHLRWEFSNHRHRGLHQTITHPPTGRNVEKYAASLPVGCPVRFDTPCHHWEWWARVRSMFVAEHTYTYKVRRVSVCVCLRWRWVTQCKRTSCRSPESINLGKNAWITHCGLWRRRPDILIQDRSQRIPSK